MATLEAELTNLDKAIKKDREDAEKATTHHERDRLLARAQRTEDFEKPAVRRRHEALAQQRASEAAALEAHERYIANQNLDRFKSEARLRYLKSGSGTSKDFEAAWPSILESYKLESALGRVPQPEQTKSDSLF